MKKRYCHVCGSEMLIQKITPTKTFRITEEGEIVRDDNNLSDETYLIAVCSNDTTHTEEEDEVYEDWLTVFELNNLSHKKEN